MSRREHPLTQHIGDAHGRIALWLDEQSAIDVAETFGPSDAVYAELFAAVERAYPKDDPARAPEQTP